MTEPVEEELLRLERELKRLQMENQRSANLSSSNDPIPSTSNNSQQQFNTTIHKLYANLNNNNMHQQETSRPQFEKAGKGIDKSCSQQALTTTPDECNVDELAGYFDNLLFIPRKMSVMAEMMYM